MFSIILTGFLLIRARSLSVVAILTLEVTGIPALSDEGLFSWPRPTFINRQTRSTVFEVCGSSVCVEFVSFIEADGVMSYLIAG